MSREIVSPIEVFLSNLRQTGVKLWSDGDNLRCSAPKNSLTAAMRQEMAERKGEILDHLKRMESSEDITVLSSGKRAETITPTPRHPDQGLPLSFSQQRLWFLDQLEHGAAYNIPAAFQIHGPLNPTVLASTLTSIVQRHEVLRTTFGKDPQQETPVQIIHPPTPVDLPVIDLCTLPPEPKKVAVQQWITLGETFVFNLSQGPLLWVKLLRLEDESHLLLLTLHHIIADGWSIGVLIHEVATLYPTLTSTTRDCSGTLPKPGIQYADFAVWQQSWLGGGELDRQLAYWEKRLAGAPPLLELPTDRPRPPVQSFRGGVERFALDASITQRLHQTSRQANATLFMTLLTGFSILLSRYSGQKDIIIGSPVANRNRSELEGLIGFFVNTLVLRMDCSDDPSFRTLLDRTRQITLEAYDHQDVPFEQLVERLKPLRTRSYTPLFQVMFILQNTPETTLELPDLKITALDQENIPAKYDLLLVMEERNGGLRGEFEFNTDLFDAATVRRMIGHLKMLLETAIGNPDQACSRLPLLDQTEYHQIVKVWNQTDKKEPEVDCIHTLVEAQVAKTPDAPAVAFEGETLSYRQLNERSNQLAHHLIRAGVRPGTLVGICLERSLDTVTGLLAILKAGGAYVPMDPNHPMERMLLLLDGVTLMITQTPLLQRLPNHGLPSIVLDRDAQTIRKEPSTNPQTQVTPQHPAYVIYTSGSTGRPKGVVVLHGRLIRMFLVTREWFNFDARDVWSLFHAFSFDFSVWEMWGALLFGGRLVVVSRTTSRSPEAFYDLLHAEKITVLNNNPSVFQALTNLEESGHAKPLSLRLVIFGAEPLKLQNLRPWFDRHGDQTPQLINLYGVTETTVHTTYHPLTRADLEETNLRIGPPRAELHPLYILDDHLQPVPIGVPGQLYAGGRGLARGYLNQPELTAKTFLPDPFDNHPDSRMQKTGDLARFLPDGNIAFLGRADFQVKVRGYRIELGEIEAVLARHPDVYEAAATTREETPGDKQLIAFVEARQSQPKADELRTFLKRKLPDYMIPATFVVMGALPRSPNGKVDRRALPSAAEGNPAMESSLELPRSPTEELVAAVWGTLLNKKQVGRDNNFFDLGGHSLMATRVISRLRDLFSLDLPLTLLFDAPTVAGISAQIDAARQQNNRMPPPPPIQPADRSVPLPLSFAQQRLWFLEQLEGGTTTYNMPGAITLTGTLHVSSLKRAIQTIIQRHESLRTSILSMDGKLVLNIGPLACDPLVQRQVEHPQELQKLVEEEVQKPFNLTSDPMFRITLIRLREDSHTLLFTFHHIVADGWSITLFIQELAQLYNAFIQNQPSPLAELPIQYADFSQWQRQWLSGVVLETQLDYWRKQLATAPALLELSTDRLRPPVQTFRGNDIYFSVDDTTCQQIILLGRTSGSTLFMTLLAAFATLLNRYSDQEDIIIGTPVANRDRPETESLIGFFVNTLALRVDLSGDPPFRELLTRVRRMALDAFAHQSIPFEQLVEEIHPVRSLSHSPLFQVMFALQNAPSEPLQLTGLTVTPLDLVGKSSKFDMSLSMEETQTGLVGVLEYNTDLFDATTMERLIGHFKILLGSIVANPDLSLSRLPILGAGERQNLLETWNDTGVVYPLQDRCIHQLFEIQVEKTPHALALVCDDGRTLDYAGLNGQANRLAHYLTTLGAGPEVLVGICMDRTLEMVVALMATLKAGSAYVPLDPSYPQDRIAFMLEDMQKGLQEGHDPIVLTKKSIREQLPQTRARVVCLDGQEAEAIAQQSCENPSPTANPNNLAYVIYTSGSTGIPKGVAIEHHSTVTLIHWTQHHYERSWFEKVLASTSICFDLSVFELFVPLSWGCSVVLVRDALSLFSEVAAGHKVTLINTVPSAMTALLRVGPLPESVRLVILAGEPFKDTLAHAIYRNTSVLHFYNLYGPSEDTTYSTFARIPENLQGAPSIGRPIANTRAYILDRHLEPVPVGVVGELHLSGDGLARNYLNRPELTAEKFIANPFLPESRERMYKTGDMARYRPDGSIDFLGRRDHQVKVRGFRIELGEVENALHQHAAVRESLVLVRSDENDNRYLAAYIVPGSNPGPSVGDLRSHLKSRIPEYMVPAVFVFMPEGLPLTANGKLDRKALPDPERSRAGGDPPPTTPTTHAQRVLTQVWQDVLGMEQIGIHDNFFDLGGDSILSIQIVARARQSGLTLTLRQIFQHQTIAELAELAVTTVGMLADQGTITGPIPLTAIQHWFFSLDMTASPHHFNQAHLLAVSPDLEVEWLEKAVHHLIFWHDALRLRFFKDPANQPIPWRQEMIAMEEAIPWTVEDLSHLTQEQWPEAIAQRSQQLQASLDLTHGPILRVACFTGNNNRPQRLLFIIHHLAVDGVSWRILLEDLERGCQQASANETMVLPAKTHSFQQWARRIAEAPLSDYLSQEIPYWIKEVTKPKGILPLDWPANRTSNTVATAAHIRISLDADQTNDLLRNVPSSYNTQVNDVLLAALARALMLWSSDIGPVSVDLEGHGREGLFDDLDISRTVGWFTTLFPIHLDAKPSEGWPGQTLKRTKEILRSVPNHGIGFGLLRTFHRDAIANTPLPKASQAEISFNYFGQYDNLLEESPFFSLASEATGSSIDPHAQRSHILEINGFVTEGKMQWDWTYSTVLHHHETIHRLARYYLTSLEQLIRHCLAQEDVGYTPSDFPDAHLDQDELDALLEELQ
ncbi:MAG: amino acid adenylation domain protein [Magnetococcales bacterium]|nr:amino acid adenylation domain protein [Magnetococcales bacterium]